MTSYPTVSLYSFSVDQPIRLPSLTNMKNDLPPACDFQISLTINCESTWPGLTQDTLMILHTVSLNRCVHVIVNYYSVQFRVLFYFR